MVRNRKNNFITASLTHNYLPHNCSGLCEMVFSIEYMDEAKCEDGDHVDTEGTEEHEEIAIVSSTYAIVDPWAVMVKCLQVNKHMRTKIYLSINSRASLNCAYVIHYLAQSSKAHICFQY